MIPFGRGTVTLYHREVSRNAEGLSTVRWSRHVLPGCSWAARRGALLNDRTLEKEDALVCRIPAEALSPAKILPMPGDVLILGEVQGEVQDSAGAAALLEAGRARGAFRVQKVTDNAWPAVARPAVARPAVIRPGIPMPHYVVSGV